jgi:predicted HAD superfamily phosphohydrolase
MVVATFEVIVVNILSMLLLLFAIVAAVAHAEIEQLDKTLRNVHDLSVKLQLCQKISKPGSQERAKCIQEVMDLTDSQMSAIIKNGVQQR